MRLTAAWAAFVSRELARDHLKLRDGHLLGQSCPRRGGGQSAYPAPVRVQAPVAFDAGRVLDPIDFPASLLKGSPVGVRQPSVPARVVRLVPDDGCLIH